MNTQDPRHEITLVERQLAGHLIRCGLPEEHALPAETFSDECAREVMVAAIAVQTAGKAVSVQSVTDRLIRENASSSLRCNIADLIEVADLGEQPDPENLRDIVTDGHENRRVERLLRDAVNMIDKGEDSRTVLTGLQSHHQVSFGSLGSFDPGPSEPLKSFPLVSLGVIPGAFSEETARVAMVPDSLAGASVLGILSVSIGASLRVKNYKGLTGANLFIMAIASSGTGKDSALNLVAEPLNEIDNQTNQTWETETKPDLLAELRKVNSEIKDLEKSHKESSVENAAQIREDSKRLERRRLEIESSLEAMPSLMVGDITKEALAVAIAAQPNEALGVVSSEARGILQVIGGRYSSGSDEDIHTGGFSGTRTKVTRLSRPPVVLRNPCLSELLMVQPDAFQKFSENGAMTDSGYLPRNILFDTKAEPLDVPENAEPFYEPLRQRWHELIGDLVAMREGPPGIVEPEKIAHELLRAYDNETRARRRKGGDLEDVPAYAARWPEIAWRIALVLHAAEHRGNSTKNLLSETMARDAITIMRWFSLETLNLLEASRETRIRKRVERLFDLLSGAEDQRMKIRNLAKSHGFYEPELKAIARRVKWLHFGKVQNPNGGPLSPVAIFQLEKAE